VLQRDHPDIAGGIGAGYGTGLAKIGNISKTQQDKDLDDIE